MVWVQDYHLMLLPMILRGLIDGWTGSDITQSELSKITEGIDGESIKPKPKAESIPGIKIGYFLHTPFPSSEIYRCVKKFECNPG
jgi:trehalose 6-phosphate synthase